MELTTVNFDLQCPSYVKANDYGSEKLSKLELKNNDYKTNNIGKTIYIVVR